VSGTFVGMPAFPEAARAALGDTQLRHNLAHATGVIRAKRAAVVGELEEAGIWEDLRLAGAAVKQRALDDLATHLETLERTLTEAGATVHWARDAAEANAVVARVARAHGADEVVKVKSMATQEIGLNEALEAEGIAAWETDLAELIVQLGDDLPSHILVPAIHRNRAEIREIFLRRMADVGRPAPADLSDEPAVLAGAAREHPAPRRRPAPAGPPGPPDPAPGPPRCRACPPRRRPGSPGRGGARAPPGGARGAVVRDCGLYRVGRVRGGVGSLAGGAPGGVGHRAVAGPDGGDLLGLGQRVQAAQGAGVGAELAVGVRDHGGAAAQHGVAGQHRALGGQHEGQRVGGVAGGAHDAHLEPVDLDDVAVLEPLGTQLVTRVEGPHAAAHPLGELLRGLGVVVVVVGQQHRCDLAGHLGHRVEVGQDRGTRVDHDRAARARLAQHPGVGAVEGHVVGVGRQHAAGPLAERPAGPAGGPHDGRAHGCLRSATSGRSRSGIDRVQPSPSGSTVGVNICTERSRAASSTAAGSA